MKQQNDEALAFAVSAEPSYPAQQSAKSSKRRPQIPIPPGSSSKLTRQVRNEQTSTQNSQVVNINVANGRPPMQKYSNDKQNVPRRAEMAVGGLRVNRQVSKTGIIQKTKAADVMYADESQPEIRQQR